MKRRADRDAGLFAAHAGLGGQAAVNTLYAMICYANAQAGKQISPEAAAALIQLAESAHHSTRH